MTDQPKKYFIRFSAAADFNKIMEFYDLNAHKNVRKRQNELMKQQVTDGAVILIEDAAGKVVACSISHPYRVTDALGNEHVRWQEFGTTRIALNGYEGLFDIMVTMQALRTFLVEPPEDRFVAQMHTAPVQAIAAKLGWRRFTPPEDLIALKEKTLDPNDPSTALRDNWFQSGIEALPVMAGHMARAIDSPLLTHRKTGEKIQLDFSKSTFFQMFEKEIRSLAAKAYGSVEAPDMTKGLAASRKTWLKNFFR